MRVLVVDDHLETADLLRLLLCAAGHDVRTTNLGSEALSVANEFVPELAFVDLHLPDISGFEVAKVLRRRAGRRVNIVAITGHDARNLGLSGTFDQHAFKPLSAVRLYQLVEVAREAIKRAEPGG